MDYLVDSEDLTAIADKIREVVPADNLICTSEPGMLMFPDDFISNVQNVSAAKRKLWYIREEDYSGGFCYYPDASGDYFGFNVGQLPIYAIDFDGTEIDSGKLNAGDILAVKVSNSFADTCNNGLMEFGIFFGESEGSVLNGSVMSCTDVINPIVPHYRNLQYAYDMENYLQLPNDESNDIKYEPTTYYFLITVNDEDRVHSYSHIDGKVLKNAVLLGCTDAASTFDNTYFDNDETEDNSSYVPFCENLVSILIFSHNL